MRISLVRFLFLGALALSVNLGGMRDGRAAEGGLPGSGIIECNMAQPILDDRALRATAEINIRGELGSFAKEWVRRGRPNTIIGLVRCSPESVKEFVATFDPDNPQSPFFDLLENIIKAPGKPAPVVESFISEFANKKVRGLVKPQGVVSCACKAATEAGAFVFDVMRPVAKSVTVGGAAKTLGLFAGAVFSTQFDAVCYALEPVTAGDSELRPTCDTEGNLLPEKEIDVPLPVIELDKKQFSWACGASHWDELQGRLAKYNAAVKVCEKSSEAQLEAGRTAACMAPALPEMRGFVPTCSQKYKLAIPEEGGGLRYNYTSAEDIGRDSDKMQSAQDCMTNALNVLTCWDGWDLCAEVIAEPVCSDKEAVVGVD